MRRRRSVYLDDEQWDALSAMARSDDRSVNAVVRRFVAEGLMRHRPLIPVVPGAGYGDSMVGEAGPRRRQPAVREVKP